MAIKQLRNHIPIGGPARREPADGSESPMRISLGLEPAWYVEHCGVELGESWHKDPFTRRSALKRMKQELLRRFSYLGLWDPTDDQDLATISGVYGAYPVPHFFGIPLRYYPDRWPELDPTVRLSVAEIEQLDAQTVLNSPMMEELFEQMELIEGEWGTIHGYLNWQGVLNNAFNIRGQEIFLDLADRPAFVHAFFDLITEVMIAFASRVQERQRASGYSINQFSVSNCVVNMISPEDYRTFVMPRDARFAAHFERYGVHTCNWDVTPYIEALAELPPLGYLDMGLVSDMAAVRETFPDTRRAVIYSPWRLQQAPLEEVRADMERIYRELAPCDVVLADVQTDTPDQRIAEVSSICDLLAERSK